MTIAQQVEAILVNWEQDVAGLRNWNSVDELHILASARREKAIASLCTLLAPTMQPDREELDRLFREELFETTIHKRFPDRESWITACVNRVMAWATPTPLRKEELETLLAQAIGESSLNWKPTPAGVYETGLAAELVQRTVETIWAWLYSKRETKKEWCEHWIRYKDTEGIRANVGYTQHPRADWDICPIASRHAPRPRTG